MSIVMIVTHLIVFLIGCVAGSKYNDSRAVSPKYKTKANGGE